MEYIGEHLIPGNLGRLALIISFTSSLLAAWAYAMYWQREDRKSWKSLARGAYWAHAISVFTVVGTLFYMMLNHYFEYDYVWKHTSLDLPARYMFSSFWEGQEGSFLLWMFWHAVLGIVLMRTSKQWESGTMLVLVLVQGFLASMLLGVYIGDLKIGQSPFVLIRELPDYIGLPWTQMANYLEAIPAFADGQGLNPLLQNYWMTIHPPTLFLGFAATIVPFAFAIAGLLTKDHKGWIKPALPWAFFGVGILGTGILMGGAWAYEALSFGGFWAWDPVENASLVPWLMLVGAAHLMLIQRNRGGSTASTYLLTLLSFLLILYSTFLTRSGILGDQSVHSFVDLGLSGQLLVYLLFFIIGAFALFFYRFPSFKKSSKEDDLSSREFWMFIGAMVLLLSSLQITFTTSLPVFNALFGPEGWIPMFDEKLSPPLDPVAHYNRYQLPFAIVTSVLVAIGQYLTYKRSASGTFWKKIAASMVVSALFTALAAVTLNFTNVIFILMLFTSFWAIFANLDFWLRIGVQWKNITGASVAHIGFGLIMLGTLISQGKQEVISSNDAYIHEDFPQNKNTLLMRNDTTDMANYRVQWAEESVEDGNVYYQLNFWENQSADVSFVLRPFIQLNEKMGNVPEPSTKHYWNRDIYTHVTYADLRDSTERYSPWQQPIEASLTPGEESIIYKEFMLRLDSVMVYSIDTASGMVSGANIGAHLTVTAMSNEKHIAIPTYALGLNGEIREDAEIEEFGLKFRFENADAESKKIIIKGWKKKDTEDDFIIIQAIVFPYINLLWIGCIAMALGTAIAIYERVKHKG